MISFFLLIFSLALFIFAAYLLSGIKTGAPFVPTGKKKAKRMIEFAGLKEGETCMDLGSGSGTIVFAAAKTGATCIGVEINPYLYWWSKARAFIGHYTNISFSRANLWNVDVSNVDLLTLFFIHDKMPLLKEKLKKEMKLGARIISNTFTFPDWPYEKKEGNVYLYRLS